MKQVEEPNPKWGLCLFGCLVFRFGISAIFRPSLHCVLYTGEPTCSAFCRNTYLSGSWFVGIVQNQRISHTASSSSHLPLLLLAHDSQHWRLSLTNDAGIHLLFDFQLLSRSWAFRTFCWLMSWGLSSLSRCRGVPVFRGQSLFYLAFPSVVLGPRMWTAFITWQHWLLQAGLWAPTVYQARPDLEDTKITRRSTLVEEKCLLK